jgi:hypothetical protein
MWQDGVLSLLSTGTSSSNSYFFNASADGDDAFFLTRDALVGQDIDQDVDLYDARVGGGFVDQVDPGCSEDTCQGSVSGAPAAGGAGSLGYVGRGEESVVRPTLSIARLSKRQLRRLGRGAPIGVRVRLSGPGVVRVVARARIAGRQRIVARGRTRARGAGVVTVRLRLNGAGLRAVRRGSSLRVALATRASGASPRTLTFRLKGSR